MILSIIVLVLSLVIAGFGVGTYNSLVSKRNLVREGWSSMNVILKKRYDLIPNLVNTVQGYASHENQTLQNVINARNAAINAGDMKQKEQAENMLSKSIGSIFALAENYPDLKANTNFLELQRELSNLETDIEKSRRYYNGTVRENNNAVESFPGNIFANIFHFKKEDFFQVNEAEVSQIPQVKF